MPSQTPRSPLADVFIPGAQLAAWGEPVEMSVHRVGELNVPTGRLCVADPFVGFSAGERVGEEKRPGFALQTPTGRFPVELALARRGPGDQRVACARVRFVAPDVRAVRWEHALGEGETLDENDPPSCGVDTGTFCFFDEAAAGLVDEATSEAWLAALEQNDVSSWTWHIAEVGASNVVMFSTGAGDGLYPTYWGFAADGQLVELVTDFEILYAYVWKKLELPWPLSPGAIEHPLLQQCGASLVLKKSLFSRPRLIVRGLGLHRLSLSDGTPFEQKQKPDENFLVWKKEPAPGTRLVIDLIVGREPLTRV